MAGPIVAVMLISIYGLCLLAWRGIRDRYLPSRQFLPEQQAVPDLEAMPDRQPMPERRGGECVVTHPDGSASVAHQLALTTEVDQRCHALHSA